MGRRSILLSLLLTSALATVARAAPDETVRPEAKRLKDLGAAAMARGDHHAALDLFVEAYRLLPTPNLRFNVALALEQLGRQAEAAAELESFLAEAPPETSREALDHARAAIEACTRQLGRVSLAVTPAGAAILVDRKSVGSAPLARPLWLFPGPHSVDVSLAQHEPRSVELTVAAGETRVVEVTLPREVEPVVAAPVMTTAKTEARPKRSRAWIVAVVAVGGVLVAGGLVAAGVAASSSSQPDSSTLGAYSVHF